MQGKVHDMSKSNSGNNEEKNALQEADSSLNLKVIH